MASRGGDPSGFVGRGVCMMSNSWRDKQHPNLINFLATFLAANSYRLNFLSVSPDFIFNNGGTSVAFVFETNWDSEKEAAVFSRYGMELGCPTFVPVCDPEMGFEKIVRIAHARGVCKKQDIITTMRDERAQAVECMDAFLRVLTSIPACPSYWLH
ncbi:hypothetical protein PVAP13_3KG207069 [Panicum virgatum]|uniref:Uncharacterized protein n=2 Tax=Panicum virgatum TaxID=38727 RepID=A0A8T0URT7_PANVG|nr:hypothetical protein PVAP13_3KG207069 [Panicum virgatum]